MSYIKEPVGVDFFVKSTLVTLDEMPENHSKARVKLAFQQGISK